MLCTLISIWLGILPAHAKTVLLRPEQPEAWRMEVAKLAAGDIVQIDDQTFVLDFFIGNGDYGRVFKTNYSGKAVAIKLQSDIKAVENNPDHQVQTQAQQFRHFAANGVPVPKILLAPPNRPYLIMEIVGKENWFAKVQKLDTLEDRLTSLAPVLDLFLKFERAKSMPKDRKNLGRNMVLSPEEEYVLVDPGGIAPIIDHVGFPMEMAIQSLRTREVALANLMLFEKVVRAGHYEQEFPKALLDRPAIKNRTADPLWALAYILWARETHHFTPSSFVETFQERFKKSHPALVVSDAVDWSTASPEDRNLGVTWINARRRELTPHFHDPYALHIVVLQARLFAFHPWQDDLPFAQETFRFLRVAQKQEALDELVFAHRNHVVDALAPIFCAYDVGEESGQ